MPRRKSRRRRSKSRRLTMCRRNSKGRMVCKVRGAGGKYVYIKTGGHKPVRGRSKSRTRSRSKRSRSKSKRRRSRSRRRGIRRMTPLAASVAAASGAALTMAIMSNFYGHKGDRSRTTKITPSTATKPGVVDPGDSKTSGLDKINPGILLLAKITTLCGKACSTGDLGGVKAFCPNGSCEGVVDPGDRSGLDKTQANEEMRRYFQEMLYLTQRGGNPLDEID